MNKICGLLLCILASMAVNLSGEESRFSYLYEKKSTWVETLGYIRTAYKASIGKRGNKHANRYLEAAIKSDFPKESEWMQNPIFYEYFYATQCSAKFRKMMNELIWKTGTQSEPYEKTLLALTKNKNVSWNGSGWIELYRDIQNRLLIREKMMQLYPELMYLTPFTVQTAVRFNNQIEGEEDGTAIQEEIDLLFQELFVLEKTFNKDDEGMCDKLGQIVTKLRKLMSFTNGIQKSQKLTPYQKNIKIEIERLDSDDAAIRAVALERLAYLRAYSETVYVRNMLTDPSENVRKEAVIMLGWCGGQVDIAAVFSLLNDDSWVVRQAAAYALENLTGMLFPFNALADKEIQVEQQKEWQVWCENISQNEVPYDVVELLNNKSVVYKEQGVDENSNAYRDDKEQVLRAVRALAVFKKGQSFTLLKDVLAPYKKMRLKHDEQGRVVRHRLGRNDYYSDTNIEKKIVLTALRSLGRHGTQAALDELIDFLPHRIYARYAADALGDFSCNAELSHKATRAMLQIFPSYSKTVMNEKGALHPNDDNGVSEADNKMFETPYALMFSLSRLSDSTGDNFFLMSHCAPYFLANTPAEKDAAIFYEQESMHLVLAHLLDLVGLRQAAADTVFRACGLEKEMADRPTYEAFEKIKIDKSSWLHVYCTHENDIPFLIKLLTNDDYMLRLQATKALMLMNAQEASDVIGTLLRESKREGDYGFNGVFLWEEYNAPGPRWREALIRALGRLQADSYDNLLVTILNDNMNALEIRHAAALALDELDTPVALEVFRTLLAEDNTDQFHIVRMVAKEALWRRGLPLPPAIASSPPIESPQSAACTATASISGVPEKIIFIKGSKNMPNWYHLDIWRQTYITSDAGPAYRPGNNIFLYNTITKTEQALTQYTEGYVADCEVSWDATKILFSYRGGNTDPWWHLFQMNSDGTGLKQLTFGPYHDVGGVYLPDGRIVFSSTRLGTRDEYHGYACNGLTIMNADGSHISVIGFNTGRDNEPAIMADGRIVFTRLEVFYSDMKLEQNLEAMFPDGYKASVLYGPERRLYWSDLLSKDKSGGEVFTQGGGKSRHRTLQGTQPQPIGETGRVILSSPNGLQIVGPGRLDPEYTIPHDPNWAVTTPFPLGEELVLCSAGQKDEKTMKKLKERGGNQGESWDPLWYDAIDLGLYTVDVKTGAFTEIYNDPSTADYEARPLIVRKTPMEAVSMPASNSYTGRLFCQSAKISQEKRVSTRGRWIRVLEGLPAVGRHQKQGQIDVEALHKRTSIELGKETRKKIPLTKHSWKNHIGMEGRVLGTNPLAVDGSFMIEVPADRFIQLQVLDSDRQVVGNQLVWMGVRPNETKSCIGCHEPQDTAPKLRGLPLAGQTAPLKCLPETGLEFNYRAKSWLKGAVPDVSEEKMRTVQAINLMGRY